ncbi:MAG: hypothetical protein LAP85_09150 [Acidobacteriia bacterium]|nr:hypothetical protein [Terriglobia bacterium]
MSGSPTLPPSVEFKDRRTGLIAYGWLEIVLGGLCALMVPLLFFALTLVPPTSGGPDSRVTGVAAMAYGVLAAALVWLGIGSILCRRWARALLLILSWGWFLAGILALGFYAVFAGALFSRDAGNPLGLLALTIGIIFIAIFFVALPGAMVLFYQSHNVKATCEARDPVVRWTDTCPLPVLASSLWLGLGSLCLMVMPLLYRSVVPWFGSLLSGAPATLILLVCAVFGLYLAWATYRRQLAAWWAALVAFALLTASAVITFMRVDLMEVYRQLGYPEDQIEQIRNFGLFTGKAMAWWTGLFFVMFLIYLLWIKKYFDRRV